MKQFILGLFVGVVGLTLVGFTFSSAVVESISTGSKRSIQFVPSSDAFQQRIIVHVDDSSGRKVGSVFVYKIDTDDNGIADQLKCEANGQLKRGGPALDCSGVSLSAFNTRMSAAEAAGDALLEVAGVKAP